MPLIAPDSVEAVRQHADLLELVRGRVELARRGGRWWGRCPFHEERTPSFSLLPPDFRRYYCHGCGASGDAIDWMREREGAAGFSEAVEALAERFSLDLRYAEESPAENAARAAAERRRELLDRAASFYASYLRTADEAAPARAYLAERGFEDALVRRFRLGYAPGAGTVLAGRALREGFSREQLVDAGLARMRGGVAADFFTARITFPIADLRGRVQGFGARSLDPEVRAKYLNSPEGPHFRKRAILFGLAEARADAARRGHVVVAEGYTDVMGLVAAGVEAAVACMGTSLTADQLRLLGRVAPEVRLCFDADDAGANAAWRTVEAARGLSVRLGAVPLPPGSDPGDLAASEEGRARLAAAVEASEPLVAFLIRSRAARAGRSPRDRDLAHDDIAGLLRQFPDSVEKDEGVRMAAGVLQLSRTMEERLRAASRQGAAPVSAAQREAADPPAVARERRLLVLALALPDAAEAHLADLPADAFQMESHRRAFGLVTSGVTALDDWPQELSELADRLRAESAGLRPEEGELREAVYRVHLARVERRAAERRAAGDEEGRLQALGLARRLRSALRTPVADHGEPVEPPAA